MLLDDDHVPLDPAQRDILTGDVAYGPRSAVHGLHVGAVRTLADARVTGRHVRGGVVVPSAAGARAAREC